MKQTEQPSSEPTELSAVRPTHLDNETCAYCGRVLEPEFTIKEHVIARRFVPKGKLARSWNLLVRACLDCNNLKSDLEDDLSAISMQPDGLGHPARPDPVLVSEAERKARRSISRRTGREVAASIERFTVNVALGPGVVLTGNFWAPPQPESDRVFRLARLQLMAFFYWLTYDRPTRRGKFWRGTLVPVLEAMKSDWGNAVHMSFMRTVVSWEPRLLCPVLADGFFKVAIRKHPAATCWSWALEWNHNLRVVGFFGDPKVAREIIGTFSPLEAKTVHRGQNKRVDFRIDAALEDAQDVLFVWGHTGGPIDSP